MSIARQNNNHNRRAVVCGRVEGRHEYVGLGLYNLIVKVSVYFLH